MLIFVLQEIFRITKQKKRKKKNFGENLKPYKVPNQLLWKISVLSHHVDFSYRYTWTWKTLSTKRTVFYIDLHEHKKKTFGILQSYLTIKLREQKKVFGMLQPYFSMDLREQKKTHLEFYNVYSCISTATYMYIITKWSRSVLHVLLMYF